LEIVPPFKGYYFIELKEGKAAHLRELVGDRKDVEIFQGDCNEILLTKVFPSIQYSSYQRALCLLDPYGLQLDWQVIESAGKSKCIDMFLNLPVMDINRNALWRNPENVPRQGIKRMTAFWGDDSWRDVGGGYEEQSDLFDKKRLGKVPNERFADVFARRLKEKAGFLYTVTPLPMRNSRRTIVYYLLFASHKPVALDIVSYIFDRYRPY
jgi:three-Cys-motif partner protein